VPSAWINLLLPISQVPCPWRKTVLSRGRFHLSSPPRAALDRSQTPREGQSGDLDFLKFTPNRLAGYTSPFRLHPGAPQPAPRTEAVVRLLPAHERQRWREAPQREARVRGDRALGAYINSPSWHLVPRGERTGDREDPQSARKDGRGTRLRPRGARVDERGVCLDGFLRRLDPFRRASGRRLAVAQHPPRCAP
jgi:hypothetical protein